MDSPTAMIVGLIRRTAEVKPIAEKNAQEAQDIYRRDNDEKASFEPTFAPGVYLFAERPPLTTAAAKRLA